MTYRNLVIQPDLGMCRSPVSTRTQSRRSSVDRAR
jgi:hypothetical protein